MTRTKSNRTAIPEVDAIKSGIDLTDKYDKLRNKEGYIVISRTSSSKKLRDKIAQETIKKEEDKLNKLKEKLESAGINATDKDKEKFEQLKKIDKDDMSKKQKKKYKKLKRKFELEKINTKLDNNDNDEEIISFKKKSHKKNKPENNPIFTHIKIRGLSKKEKPQRAKKENNKDVIDKDEAEVSKRFKEVEDLTKDNLADINQTLNYVNNELKDMTNVSSRTRGRSTAISNYLQAKSSLITAKQKAISDIMTARTKVYDITLKKNKDKNIVNDNEIISRMFPSMIKNGKLSDYANNIDIKNTDKKKKKHKKNKEYEYDSEDAKNLFARIKEDEKDGKISYNDYDKHIEYEGKYIPVIKKSWSTGEWEFAAINSDNKFVDVPKKILPKHSSVDLRFDDEKNTAIDTMSGKIFKVFQYPTI